jgi:hypothetical protein
LQIAPHAAAAARVLAPELRPEFVVVDGHAPVLRKSGPPGEPCGMGRAKETGADKGRAKTRFRHSLAPLRSGRVVTRSNCRKRFEI